MPKAWDPKGAPIFKPGDRVFHERLDLAGTIASHHPDRRRGPSYGVEFDDDSFCARAWEYHLSIPDEGHTPDDENPGVECSNWWETSE